MSNYNIVNLIVHLWIYYSTWHIQCLTIMWLEAREKKINKSIHLEILNLCERVCHTVFSLTDIKKIHEFSQPTGKNSLQKHGLKIGGVPQFGIWISNYDQNQLKNNISDSKNIFYTKKFSSSSFLNFFFLRLKINILHCISMLKIQSTLHKH